MRVGRSGPGFNAVAESRKWKEAVGHEIAGMSDKEVVAYFNDFAEKYFAGRRERERKREFALAH